MSLKRLHSFVLNDPRRRMEKYIFCTKDREYVTEQGHGKQRILEKMTQTGRNSPFPHRMVGIVDLSHTCVKLMGLFSCAWGSCTHFCVLLSFNNVISFYRNRIACAKNLCCFDVDMLMKSFQVKIVLSPSFCLSCRILTSFHLMGFSLQGAPVYVRWHCL